MIDEKKLNDTEFDETKADSPEFDDNFLNQAVGVRGGNDKDRFTLTELASLRNDLLQGGMIDSYEAAELLQVFLTGRGYGVSAKAALDAAGRVEMAGCALPVLQYELENLAMVM